MNRMLVLSTLLASVRHPVEVAMDASPTHPSKAGFPSEFKGELVYNEHDRVFAVDGNTTNGHDVYGAHRIEIIHTFKLEDVYMVGIQPGKATQVWVRCN